jgi:fermentation-respiration switch protein FrsA (DUF1100 family)
MKQMATIIVIVFGLCIGLLISLYFLQDRLLYFPLSHISTTPADIGLAYETIELTTSDRVKLSGWFIPTENARATVLFFHGNAGNISHRLESIEVFHRLGLSVLIIDYRGYGQSQGKPSEYGTYLDAEAAWQYLVKERQIPPEQIILFGRSLGGAVAAWLAQQHSPGALILESTFTSVPDVAAKHYPFLPVRWLVRAQYNSQERLPTIKCPVLIIHSPDDEIIPFEHGRQLFAVAPEPKDFLQLTGGHNEGFLITGQAYQAGLAKFINTYLEQ